MNIKTKTNEISDDIVIHRRFLHKHPELSQHEYNTQKYIISILEKHHIDYQTGANTGVVASIGTGKNCVGIRADMDALPIQELNNIPYKSIHPNVMHACGHDVHMAILLGVAFVLKDIENTLNGVVKLFFQPNEEVSSGALDFIKEGFLDNPHVDHMLGLHVMPYLDVGEIEVRDGVLTGSSEYVEIEVFGKSAHAAYPEKGIDALIIASDIVLKLQSIISRNISPLDSAALSLGIVKGGTKPNIIADYVTLSGTLRTLSIETKNTIKQRINDICINTAKSYNGHSKVTYKEGYRPLINNSDVNLHIIKNAKEMDTITSIKHKEHPSLGVEDFGYYLEQTKGAFFHLGCGNKFEGITEGLHTSTFKVDERCIKIGIELQIRNTLSILGLSHILEDYNE
jgi:amidohydrolase